MRSCSRVTLHAGPPAHRSRSQTYGAVAARVARAAKATLHVSPHLLNAVHRPASRHPPLTPIQVEVLELSCQPPESRSAAALLRERHAASPSHFVNTVKQLIACDWDLTDVDASVVDHDEETQERAADASGCAGSGQRAQGAGCRVQGGRWAQGAQDGEAQERAADASGCAGSGCGRQWAQGAECWAMGAGRWTQGAGSGRRRLRKAPCWASCQRLCAGHRGHGLDYHLDYAASD